MVCCYCDVELNEMSLLFIYLQKPVDHILWRHVDSGSVNTRIVHSYELHWNFGSLRGETSEEFGRCI